MIAGVGQSNIGASIVSSTTQSVNEPTSSTVNIGQNPDVSNIPSTSRIGASMVVAEMTSVRFLYKPKACL